MGRDLELEALQPRSSLFPNRKDIYTIQSDFSKLPSCIFDIIKRGSVNSTNSDVEVNVHVIQRKESVYFPFATIIVEREPMQ